MVKEIKASGSRYTAIVVVVLLMAGLVVGACREDAVAKKKGMEGTKWKNPPTSTLTMQARESYQARLSAVAKGARVTYKSSKKSIASVTVNGRIEAYKRGKAWITATVRHRGTKKIRLRVNVVPQLVKAQRITLSTKRLDLTLNGSGTKGRRNMGATIRPRNATVKKVSYMSDNEKVAVVDAKGNVKAKGEGKTKVFALAADGRGASASCMVTVRKKDPPKPFVYSEMIADTYISSGNNVRVKSVIEKARNGEAVRIACMGGSVTEGYQVSGNECYGSRFHEMFKAEYGKDGGENVSYINAGMSGTNSAIGWTRYDRDVTKALGTHPDLFVIEYAINDFEDMTITNGAALESMVRDVLSLPNRPAVIMLFSTNLDLGNMEESHIPIGEAYGLPMVSMEGLVPYIKDGRMAAEEFFLSDHDHPTANGHKIMAESLMYCLGRMDGEPLAGQDAPLPDKPVKVGGADYQGLQTIYQGDELPEGLTLRTGSFTKVDGATNIYEFNGKPKYPANWMRDVTANNPFVIEVNCKNMLLVYKSSGGSGKANVYLDGKRIKTIDGSWGGGWNNAVVDLLFNDKSPADHTVRIEMAKGYEARGFTILAFGYAK